MKPVYCRRCKEPITDPDDVVTADDDMFFHVECYEKGKEEHAKPSEVRHFLGRD